MRRVGPFRLELQRNRFQTLVRSVISQQISRSAARTIRDRLEEMVPGRQLTAAKLQGISDDQFRAAGISRPKARYIRDLVDKTMAGQIRFARYSKMPDEDVIAELVQVKGIGRWTAQMFLIFSLGRLDVFPFDDLGVRMALQRLYDLDELPDKQTSHRIAEPWHPYASVATWYCWRSLD